MNASLLAWWMLDPPSRIAFGRGQNGASWVLCGEGTHPLHEAAKQNNAEVAYWLLHFGADPARRDSAGGNECPSGVSASQISGRVLPRCGAALDGIEGDRDFVTMPSTHPFVDTAAPGLTPVDYAKAASHHQAGLGFATPDERG